MKYSKELYCETHGMLLYGADVREHLSATRCNVQNVEIPKVNESNDVELFALPTLEPRAAYDIVTLPNGAYEWVML